MRQETRSSTAGCGRGDGFGRRRTTVGGARLNQRTAYHTTKINRMIRTIFGTAIIGQVYGTVDRGSRKLQPEPGPQGPRFEPADQIGNRRRQGAMGLALGKWPWS